MGRLGWIAAGALFVATGGWAATVREPAYGLPHFYAETDVELARENGREIAKDRLGQLILLARVGRGTLSQAFGLLSPSTFDDDVEARTTAYTSSELNRMFERLPARERAIVLAYCEGVNDTLDAVVAGTSPKPVEISALESLGLAADLFGNATNVSDQVDPYYRAPGGADPERPSGGFQFTPEMAMSVAVLEVRNFGFNSFEEDRRLGELQALVAKHGGGAGTEIWRDLNFLDDPLAPISVPESSAPGYGGPLAKRGERNAAARRLAAAAARFPRRDWAGARALRDAAAERRAEFAARLGAWPKLGSYAWVIGASRSATGNPWVGGFPQTGIQTPSIMHFAENRSGEGIQGIGMEFAGAPFILIGQTDSVAYTTTTAQSRVVDTFFETLVLEDADAIRYVDEGVPAPLAMRIEIFRGVADQTRTMWRSHERAGNGGTRPIIDFLGDAEGVASGGSLAELVDDEASFDAGFVGGWVALVGGTGAGQIRPIGAAAPTTLSPTTPWTTAPDATSVYVAAKAGQPITAVAADSAVWMEESTAAFGFSGLQRARSVLDVRRAIRLIPSTHNFLAADNRSWNALGSDLGRGNIAYYQSGYARHRGAEEKLLPLDGSGPNPLVTVAGSVASATPSTLRAPGAFGGLDLRPPDENFRYDFPGLQGVEYVVAITSGSGFKQTRRIAANDADVLQLESPWGVVPAPGDGFEVYPIAAMPEAINPAEGYVANWNNKAATADDALGFGRNHRAVFILERLAADSAWDRAKQRQLNEDVAGLDGRGRLGRYLVPRLRQAVDAEGDGGVPEVGPVLAALEAFEGAPAFGRRFVDPVEDRETFGEIAFLSDLIDDLFDAIYDDEYDGAVARPNSTRRLALVTHALDSAAADVPGRYVQRYAGDYFGGAGWATLLRDTLAANAPAGIPAPGARAESRYNHPLNGVFPLSFPPTPEGNRGIWEQIVEVGDVVVGEFIFPLGQSGLIEADGGGVRVDPDFTSLHPVWRDWRFVPMLQVSEDLEAAGTPDVDGDGVFDGYERWYFGDTRPKAKSDADRDGAGLLEEFLAGLDAGVADTDGDGIADGSDGAGQDGQRSRFTRLRGRFALPGGGRDRLSLAARFGGGADFDPATQELTLALRDADGTLYEVTLPAGTLTSRNGVLWRYRDPSGSLAGLESLVLALGSERKPGRVKLKTVRLDLSAVGSDDRDVEVELTLGGHAVDDERGWLGRRRQLVSGRE